MPEEAKRVTIQTVGHSTRMMEDFIEILRSHGVTQLVDVRSMPHSRRHPQFNRESLAVSLKSAGIRYRHMPGLGGRRRPRAGSINTGWRNASFRGYADYMQTAQFRDNLQRLIDLSSDASTAIMCAEALPWRCHRSLISDALVARGIPVLAILSVTEIRPHELTSFAEVQGAEVTYPAPGQDPVNLQLKFDETETLR
jgi:uncharacterized protein (DUF488 family)